MRWLINWWYKLGSPKYVIVFVRKVQLSIWLLAVATIACSIVWGLYGTPDDYQQGNAYRIIYWHVPTAALSLGLYVGMATCFAVFYIWRIKLSFYYGYSLAIVGAVFTLVSLVSGALWGKPMWGVYWTWDARLTSQLLMFFLYLGVLLLYDSLGRGPAAKMSVCLLGIVGVVNVPIIHYSVYWWNSLHQGATILTFDTPKIAASMAGPLYLGLVGFALFALAFVLTYTLVQTLAEQKK